MDYVYEQLREWREEESTLSLSSCMVIASSKNETDMPVSWSTLRPLRGVSRPLISLSFAFWKCGEKRSRILRCLQSFWLVNVDVVEVVSALQSFTTVQLSFSVVAIRTERVVGVRLFGMRVLKKVQFPLMGSLRLVNWWLVYRSPCVCVDRSRPFHSGKQNAFT